MEIWKDIQGYENSYQVSNLGNVRDKRRNKLIKTFKNNKGYLRVGLYSNSKEKKYLIHRLVAIAFVPNPNNYPHVNHKDENPLNDNADNLEWCTHEYNMNYGTCRKRATSKTSKKVYQYDLNRNLIKVWDSVKECRHQGFTNVWYLCNGKSKSNKPYKGYLWSYTPF